MNRDELEKIIIDNKPVKCEMCNGKVFYVNSGMYRCEQCGYEMYDDFGKVRNYWEVNGPAPALIISEATGVSTELIEGFLRQGRVEIPDGSKYYIKCEKCGCSIRFGRFCPDCVRELAGGIRSVLCADIGEKPKRVDMSGKMHYLNRAR